MESLDITSAGLRRQGYGLCKEGQTIVLYHDQMGLDPNGQVYRCSFYKNDWDKTKKRVEETLAKEGVDRLVIQAVLADMSRNYKRLMNGEATNAVKASASEIELETPLYRSEIGGDDGEPTFERWVQELLVRRQQLQDTIKNASQPLPHLWLPLEYDMSVKNVLHIQDCTLPFAGILLGVPSSLKTVAIELFRRYWNSYYKDDFSPKGWVSHYSGLTEEQLQENDLLPQIKQKLFLTPELAPLFTGNEDELKKAFGILTRILDGKGLESHSGTQGGRGYYGEFMFVWLGAAVDVSPRVHRMMGNLGPKMYFLRLPKAFKKDSDIVEQLKNPQFTTDLAKIEKALFHYLKWFEACPTMQPYKNNTEVLKLTWDYERNDIKALKYIAKLSMLIGPLRGVVEVWDTENTQGSGYGFSIPIVEEPDRAATQLYNLARGHALIEGRNYITMSDIPLLIKVVLSTAPIARVAVFDMLLAMGGTLKTADIKEGLGISHHTVHKTMTELVLLGLVDGDKEGEYTNSEKTITLKRQHKWCLGRRFRQLREGFSPARKPRKQPQKEKRSSNQGDNMDGDPIKLEEKSEFVKDDFPSSFWVYYNEVEKEHLDNSRGTEPRLASETELKWKLIASGRFTAGEAAQLVKDAIDSGRVRRIGFDTLVKNSQSNVSKSE